jgi:hypothetical protein
MKTTSCDICKNKFSKRDNYVSGSLIVRGNANRYDNGIYRHIDEFDVCEKCLIVVDKFIEKLKNEKEK